LSHIYAHIALLYLAHSANMPEGPYIFVFNALHLVDSVMIGLVLRLHKFMVYCGFLLTLFLVISVLAIYIVSSGTLNLNSINQSMHILS